MIIVGYSFFCSYLFYLFLNIFWFSVRTLVPFSNISTSSFLVPDCLDDSYYLTTWFHYYMLYMFTSSILVFIIFFVFCFLYFGPYYYSNISPFRKYGPNFNITSEQKNINLRFGRDKRDKISYFYSFKIYKFLWKKSSNFFLFVEEFLFTNYYFSTLLLLDFVVSFLLKFVVKWDSFLKIFLSFYNIYFSLVIFYFRFFYFSFFYFSFLFLIRFIRFFNRLCSNNLIVFILLLLFKFFYFFTSFFIIFFFNGLMYVYQVVYSNLEKFYFFIPNINSGFKINLVNTFINFRVAIFLLPTVVVFLLVSPSVYMLYVDSLCFKNIDFLFNGFNVARSTSSIDIFIFAKQWFWEYEYYSSQGFNVVSFDSKLVHEDCLVLGQPRLLVASNPLILPCNSWVKLYLTSTDVIHSFSIPTFFLKVDLVPGRISEVWFTTTSPGVFYGQCSEICGINHAYMPIMVNVI